MDVISVVGGRRNMDKSVVNVFIGVDNCLQA